MAGPGGPPSAPVELFERVNTSEGELGTHKQPRGRADCHQTAKEMCSASLMFKATAFLSHLAFQNPVFSSENGATGLTAEARVGVLPPRSKGAGVRRPRSMRRM